MLLRAGKEWSFSHIYRLHVPDSRLQAIATPLVPNMEKVQIIPPPKEVDPMVLPWKGGSVLGKMEGVNELWVTRADWVRYLCIPSSKLL